MKRFKATLLDEAAVMRALKRISHEIVERNNGAEELCIIGIRRRGIALAELIADNIAQIEGMRPEVGSLDVTGCRDDRAETGPGTLGDSDIPFSVEGRKVVLVDDVLFTGRTAAAALDALKQLGRASQVQLAVLVDRGHRELPIRGDYVGKNIPTSRTERISVKIPPYDDRTGVELYEG